MNYSYFIAFDLKVTHFQVRQTVAVSNTLPGRKLYGIRRSSDVFIMTLLTVMLLQGKFVFLTDNSIKGFAACEVMTFMQGPVSYTHLTLPTKA